MECVHGSDNEEMGPAVIEKFRAKTGGGRDEFLSQRGIFGRPITYPTSQ